MDKSAPKKYTFKTRLCDEWHLLKSEQCVWTLHFLSIKIEWFRPNSVSKFGIYSVKSLLLWLPIYMGKMMLPWLYLIVQPTLDIFSHVTCHIAMGNTMQGWITGNSVVIVILFLLKCVLYKELWLSTFIISVTQQHCKSRWHPFFYKKESFKDITIVKYFKENSMGHLIKVTTFYLLNFYLLHI